MITLTAEERKKFADYLEQEAMQEDGLVVQMEKLNLPTVKHYKLKIAARRLVAHDLRGIEEY